MNKTNNIENTGNIRGSLQSSRESVMKRARQYVIFLGFVAAILTVLFSGAGTVQAKNGKCFYNSDVDAISLAISGT